LHASISNGDSGRNVELKEILVTQSIISLAMEQEPMLQSIVDQASIQVPQELCKRHEFLLIQEGDVQLITKHITFRM